MSSDLGSGVSAVSDSLEGSSSAATESIEDEYQFFLVGIVGWLACFCILYLFRRMWQTGMCGHLTIKVTPSSATAPPSGDPRLSITKYHAPLQSRFIDGAAEDVGIATAREVEAAAREAKRQREAAAKESASLDDTFEREAPSIFGANLSPAAAAAPPLPDGWWLATAPSGRTYYCTHNALGQATTQWTHPAEEPPPDAPPPPHASSGGGGFTDAGSTTHAVAAPATEGVEDDNAAAAPLVGEDRQRDPPAVAAAVDAAHDAEMDLIGGSAEARSSSFAEHGLLREGSDQQQERMVGGEVAAGSGGGASEPSIPAQPPAAEGGDVYPPKKKRMPPPRKKQSGPPPLPQD